MSWTREAHARLGEERLERYMETRALLDFELATLPLSVMAAGLAGYSDEALDNLIQDAGDLSRRATAHMDTVIEIAEHWRAQRQESEQ